MKHVCSWLSIKGLCSVLLTALSLVGTGCQKLFLDQNALSKNQPVTFSLKVDETAPLLLLLPWYR